MPNKHLRTKSYSLDEMHLILHDCAPSVDPRLALRSLQTPGDEMPPEELLDDGPSQIQDWILTDQQKPQKEIIVEDLQTAQPPRQNALYGPLFGFGRKKHPKQPMDQNNTINESNTEMLTTPNQKQTLSYQLLERHQNKSTLPSEESTQQKHYQNILSRSKLSQLSSERGAFPKGITTEAFRLQSRRVDVSRFKQILLKKKSHQQTTQESNSSTSLQHLSSHSKPTPDSYQALQNEVMHLKKALLQKEAQQLITQDQLVRQQEQLQQLRRDSQFQLDILKEEVRGQAEQLRQVQCLLGQQVFSGFIKGEMGTKGEVAVNNSLLRRQMLSEFLTKKM